MITKALLRTSKYSQRFDHEDRSLRGVWGKIILNASENRLKYRIKLQMINTVIQVALSEQENWKIALWKGAEVDYSSLPQK